MFDNPQVLERDLPGISELDWQGLSPAYLRQLIVQHLAVALAAGFIGAATTIFGASEVAGELWFWTAVPLFVLAAGLWSRAALPHKGYAIRHHDILFRTGLAWRKQTAIPFNRVQHVETTRSPLERFFGLATLEFYTAGGASGDLKIPGLDSATADRLRSFVLRQVGLDSDGD